jgi:hypothetical protein
VERRIVTAIVCIHIDALHIEQQRQIARLIILEILQN